MGTQAFQACQVRAVKVASLASAPSQDKVARVDRQAGVVALGRLASVEQAGTAESLEQVVIAACLDGAALASQAHLAHQDLRARRELLGQAGSVVNQARAVKAEPQDRQERLGSQARAGQVGIAA